MVRSVTSLTGSGLRDWAIQRLTAIILGLYFIFLLGFIIAHPQFGYLEWASLFYHPAMKMFTFLAILSMVLHAWIGMWVVVTDYIDPPALRLIVQTLVILSLFVMLVWGILILWG
jgi:succinate dehydrogenase / fumarate reductase membrane anchor subunit